MSSRSYARVAVQAAATAEIVSFVSLVGPTTMSVVSVICFTGAAVTAAMRRLINARTKLARESADKIAILNSDEREENKGGKLLLKKHCILSYIFGSLVSIADHHSDPVLKPFGLK